MSRLAAYGQEERSAADAAVREYLPLVKKIALRLAAKLPAEILALIADQFLLAPRRDVNIQFGPF